MHFVDQFSYLSKFHFESLLIMRIDMASYTRSSLTKRLNLQVRGSKTYVESRDIDINLKFTLVEHPQINV